MFDYNSLIDYTLLDLNAINAELLSLCQKAIKLSVASVCVYPEHVSLVSNQLKKTNVLTCSVISFPSGSNKIQEKVEEAERAIRNGADEIDVVINYKLIADLDYLKSELNAIKHGISKFKNKIGQPITLKVIVESGLLSLDETRRVTQVCIDSKVDFIKTSTGKVAVGAELSKVQIMHETIISSNSNLKIKASGGIRTIEDIEQFLPFVSRLGMGYHSVDVLNEI
jgi:deoxyribose-phosphate aldolase